MDNELWEVLSSFKSALDMIIDRLDEIDSTYSGSKSDYDERIQKLESTLYDDIIGPTQRYIDETNKNNRFNDFSAKHGERLGSFNDALRSLEGDDFDLTQSAFDKYDSYEGEKPDEDAFVDALVEEVSAQLDKIKEGLGLPSDAEIAVTETPDGGAEVEVVDEGDAEEPSLDEEVAEDEEEEGDNPEEVAAFEEELKNQK